MLFLNDCSFMIHVSTEFAHAISKLDQEKYVGVRVPDSYYDS